jgi:hypothetical protein
MKQLSGISWHIDHDYSYNYYLLVGDFRGQRYVQSVYDGFWGIPLLYKKWCIERRFKILFGTIDPDLATKECTIHNTDWNGLCFKCNKQVFIRHANDKIEKL